MKRFLLNLTATLSLILLMAVVVLWVRSYSHTDYIAMENVFDRADPTPDSPGICWHTWALMSQGGSLGLIGRLYEMEGVSEWPENGRYFSFGGTSPRCPFSSLNKGWSGFWFYCHRRALHPDDASDASVILGRQVTVPMWFLCAGLGILPAMKLKRLLRRPVNTGLCLACGYDLRTTPDRCPECGAVVTPSGDSV
jgi:hypothetical protein